MSTAGWPDTAADTRDRIWRWAAGASTVVLVVVLFSSAGDGFATATALVGVTGFVLVLPAVVLASRQAPSSPFPPLRTVLAGASATVAAALLVAVPVWWGDPWPEAAFVIGFGLPIAAIPVFVGGLVARHIPRRWAVALSVVGLAATLWAVAVVASEGLARL